MSSYSPEPESEKKKKVDKEYEESESIFVEDFSSKKGKKSK